MHLDHFEISVAKDTLTQAFATDLNGLLEQVFGWRGSLRRVEHTKFGETTELTYAIDRGFRLIIREGPQALQPGQEDHLGFAVDFDEFGRLSEACGRFASQHRRTELSYFDQGRPTRIDLGDREYQTFFIRFLLPIWFQFETTHQKRRSGEAP